MHTENESIEASPARKKARVEGEQSDPKAKTTVMLSLSEDPEVLDDLLLYFYRGKPHSLVTTDLDTSPFHDLMALLRMATKYEVVLVQDMLEHHLW